MVRLSAMILLLGLLLAGETFAKKLVFKDGTIEDVDSYEVVNIGPAGQQKKVRYFSSERNAWEEAPFNAIDLQGTERLNSTTQPLEGRKKPAKARILTKEEHDAVKTRAEIANQTKPFEILPGIILPESPGIYFLEDSRVTALNKNGVKVQSDKKRMAASAAGLPIKMKKVAVIHGAKSVVRLKTNRPSFYLNFSNARQVKLLRLKEKSGHRQISEILLKPILGTAERKEQEFVPTSLEQMAPGVNKISPVQTLLPGEYGFIVTPETNPLVAEPITVELEIWDFGLDT